ncbi:MAG: hypothetical protein M8861_10140 [marine benthic group bacterium]|nr:hypothetical protein [Gemmatimonadota bacterium]
MTDHRDMEDRSGAGSPGTEEDLLGPDLRALLSTLPKELPPERDLTQEIAAQTWDSRDRLPGTATIDAEATKRRRQPSPWWSGQGLKLAAAAVALIVVTSAVTTVLVRDQAGNRDDASATVAGAAINEDPSVLEATFVRDMEVENQFSSAIADMVAALEANRDQLPPETVQLIEENLRIIDEAIQHSLAALESAPQSLPLQQAVMTSYERKLDFLRQAAAITAEG